MNDSSVSVIIPTRNRSELLRRALESVCAQTCPPKEIIVVDDGSTDDTAQWIDVDFPQVRYLRQPHRGVAAARNNGIGAATGEWVALLDSDDEWRPAKLERQLDATRAQPCYRLCHTEEVWIRRGRRVNPGKRHAKSGGAIFRRCLPLCVISPSSVLVKRSLLEEVGGFDETLPVCEDYDLWLRICSRYPVLFVDEALVVKHGGHDDQLSRRFWGMDRYRIAALEKILASGVLSTEDREATIRTLLDKIEVYLTGARKRDKSDEVETYGTMWARYHHELERRAAL